jgi:hypothetical protein
MADPFHSRVGFTTKADSDDDDDDDDDATDVPSVAAVVLAKRLGRNAVLC